MPKFVHPKDLEMPVKLNLLQVIMYVSFIVSIIGVVMKLLYGLNGSSEMAVLAL